MNNTSSKNSALLRWLKQRQGTWKKLSEISAPGSGAINDVNEYRQVLDFAEGLRSLASDVSLARITMPGSQLTRTLEILLAQCSSMFNEQPGGAWRLVKRLYRDEVGQLFYLMRQRILTVTLIFVMSVFIGWWLIINFPDLVSLFASEQMIEEVEKGSLWTDGLLNIMPSSILAIQIISNNVMVTLFAYAMGVFYGLGTLYIIVLNGLMLGSVFAFTYQHHLFERLLAFILPHGLVELSVICLAGAAGFSLGEALARPGQKSRIESFQKSVSVAGKFLVVCVPFFICSGVIEGYISPNDSYSMANRVVIGVAYELIFLLFITGKIWQTESLNQKSVKHDL